MGQPWNCGQTIILVLKNLHVDCWRLFTVGAQPHPHRVVCRDVTKGACQRPRVEGRSVLLQPVQEETDAHVVHLWTNHKLVTLNQPITTHTHTLYLGQQWPLTTPA